MNLGTKMLTKDDVMEGVAEVLHEVQIEATFPDGTNLIFNSINYNNKKFFALTTCRLIFKNVFFNFYLIVKH